MLPLLVDLMRRVIPQTSFWIRIIRWCLRSWWNNKTQQQVFSSPCVAGLFLCCGILSLFLWIRAASLTFDETTDVNRLRVTISNWFCPLAIMMIIFLSACPRLKTKLDFLFPLHTTYSQKHKSSPCRARQLDIILENLSGHISRLIIFNGSALKASHHCNVTLEAENINLVLLRSGIFLDIFCTKRNHDPKPQQSREYTAQFNTFSFHLECLVSFPASIPETTRPKMLAAKLNKVLHRA